MENKITKAQQCVAHQTCYRCVRWLHYPLILLRYIKLKKMRDLGIIILNIIIALALNAQDKYAPKNIERNNIKEIDCYLFEENSKTDSFLITKEDFNSKGRRTKITIYDSTGTIQSEYLYNYKYDTLRIERITKFYGNFSSRTKIFYDKNNREIKAIDYDINDKKTGTYSKTKYNDRKLTEETKIYLANKLSVHVKKKFDKNHILKEYSCKKNGKWTHELIKDGVHPNCSLTEIENFQNSGLKLKREKRKINERTSIIGLKGKLKLFVNDILITEKYINKKGLIEFEKQYLNDKLIAVKKYKYVSY